jgi:hypothetical protein
LPCTRGGRGRGCGRELRWLDSALVMLALVSLPGPVKQ